MRIGQFAFAVSALFIPLGCGGHVSTAGICGGNIVAAFITPQNLVLDHTAVTTGWNHITFAVYGNYDQSNCVELNAVPLNNATWSASDSQNVLLTPVDGSPNKMTVTCMDASSDRVTISASSLQHGVTVTGTTYVICK
jgi:hypothetical protein